jgi:hypothetical protein
MCPLGFLMLGSTLQDLPSDSPAACRSACRRRQASPRTGSPNERSWRAPGLSWSATRSSWPLPNHLPRRRPSPNRNLRWPSTASRSWTQRATTPTPAIPAIGLSAHRRAPGPHSGRTQRTRQRTDTGRPHRTPTPDPGQRTPGRSDGTGHWTPIAGTGKRGHWTLAPDTGHRTPDTGRGRGQGDDGTVGIRTSWAAMPSDRALGRPTVFLWTAPRRTAVLRRISGRA